MNYCASSLLLDIDECLESICGVKQTCINSIGSFLCLCSKGYYLSVDEVPRCQDIDECFNSAVCGPNSVCTNTIGSYDCACAVGYKPTNPTQQPSKTNICIDINECVEYNTTCGPVCNCTNSIGSYFCKCYRGYRETDGTMIASITNPCIDINECIETPGICGPNTVCTNLIGSYYCSCPDGYYPSTGVEWLIDISYCKNVLDVLGETMPQKGQTKERAFLDNMGGQLQNNTDFVLPTATVSNFLSASMQVSGVGPHVKTINVSSEGDGVTGSVILGISDRLAATMFHPAVNQTTKVVETTTVSMTLLAIGPQTTINSTVPLFAKGHAMEINLLDLAKANNGSVAAVFMTLNGMENLLSHQYFKTDKETEMYSDVLTAILPLVNNTNITEPVNFTIQHKQPGPASGMMTCVYWDDKSKDADLGQQSGGTNKKDLMSWSEQGCWVAHTDENYTVCSCSHLSTFALIMQIGQPPPDDSFLEWINRVCVIIGLFFFGLAILTFLLCSWNPKVNNTARLHLCINLALSQMLLLWNDRYVDQKLACKVMAGLLHFLVVAGFVWMQLEALQLYLLVRRLTKVQVIQRDGLPRPLLYLIGYGIPFVIVGVSALVCWLSTQRNFNWALTGPVIVILGLNWMLFCATLWSLRPTLASMKSDVSQSKDTRLIVFKILAQFVILGCTWIIGLYQSNLFFRVLFIILNSQQGTCLYIVHCLLNKEVREEYIKWLTCSFAKDRSEHKDANSVSEDDLDKPVEQTNKANKDDKQL
uniref:adhesion G protein-coupled receptor E1-like n=1 Tax=Monopterus albus TaxID=43700 RepID=UPI0009B48E03|nr:adhesion G protein-coupled receptor E1-like [Monopterus albus]